MPTIFPTKLPALSDPSDVDSELDGDSLAVTPAEPTEEEEQLVALVEERFQASVNSRKLHEGKFFLSLAFYLGDQHLGWSTNGARLIDTRAGGDGWRSYCVHNKIEGKILKLLARAMEAAPDASFRPEKLDSPLDNLAAAEARAVHETLDRRDNQSSQLSDEALWTLTTGLVCRKHSWDPTMEAEVPDYDAQGNLIGSVMARVGDIKRETVPVFDLYPDPKARIKGGKIVRCAYIIHSHVRDLQEVQTQYGKQGFALKGEIAAGQDGYIESKMASIVGDVSQASSHGKKSAVVVREMWEFPSPRYKNGRLIVEAGGRILRNDKAWPCSKRDSYPFVPLAYKVTPGSFWSGNAVYPLISAQRTYNRALSTLEEYLQNPWGKYFVPRGAEIGADQLNDPREAVYFNPGFMPQREDPPGLPPVISQALEIMNADIDDLSGVHDVSDGQAPNDVTAASALEILKQQDQTQQRSFSTNISTFIRQCTEWEIALARDNYSEPRLMAAQDVAPADPEAVPGSAPPTGASEVMAFRALTNGGSCHIAIEDGTSASISPIARLQLVQTLIQQNFFGPPGDPDAALAALEVMQEIRSDALTQRLINVRKSLQQKQMAQAQMAQQQMQQQHANATAQQDNQAQNQAQNTMLQTALQNSQQQQQASQQAQSASQLKIAELQADLAKAYVQHAHDLELEAQQQAHENQAVKVTLAGSLTPPQETSAATQAGLKSGTNPSTENTNATTQAGS